MLDKIWFILTKTGRTYQMGRLADFAEEEHDQLVDQLTASVEAGFIQNEEQTIAFKL